MSQMDDDISLPPLNRSGFTSATQTPLQNPRKRALQLESYAPNINTSSDPAVFSSDDDPSLENYQPSSERSKRRLVGSWYAHNAAVLSDPLGPPEEDLRQAKKPVARRIFQRNYDSGIFLGSDGTVVEDEINVMPPPSIPLGSRPRGLTMSSLRTVSMAELSARRVIDACVEEGNESVDLSGFNLESINNDMLVPITTLTCIPTVVNGAPFEPKDPEIKLLLSNNQLSLMPGAILDISNLTYLSLRGNQLTELPSNIGKLSKLDTINVALNKLRYLPRSLLNLIGPGGSLQNLHIHPNPFIQPEQNFTVRHVNAETCLADATGKSAVYLTRSAIQYLSTPGRVLSHNKLQLKEGPLIMPSNGPELDDAHPFLATAQRNIPSLMELCLRQCYSSSHLQHMSSVMESASYKRIQDLMQETMAVHEQRGRVCSVCGTQFVKPCTQWIEWWALGDAATTGPNGEEKKPFFTVNEEASIAVPFLAEGCTWACVPKRLETGTSLEELRKM